MSDDEFTPKRFNVLSINAFCVISNVLSSQSRLKAQPVYQVSSPSFFVGHFATNAAWKYLLVSFELAITLSSQTSVPSQFSDVGRGELCN